jgi:hypothetical protein
MKLFCSFLIVCFSCFVINTGHCRDEGGKGPVATNPSLRKELLDRVEKDQAVRTELIKAGVSTPDKALLERMKAIDEQNTKRIKEIVIQIGWPSTKLVGVDGANAAFLLVQHSDLKTQKEMLPLLKKAFQDGDVSGQNYALLLDRVLVGEGKPQLYGTQALPFEQWTEQEPKLAPIEDEKNVDERRQKVGLPSLDEYRKLLKQVYFPKK